MPQSARYSWISVAFQRFGQLSALAQFMLAAFIGFGMKFWDAMLAITLGAVVLEIVTIFVGIADRAYQAARDYAADRVQGAVIGEPAGTPIEGHPDVARLLVGADHRRVLVFRPVYPVGGQELGYLPGGEGEKMAPWAQAVYDTLSALVSSSVIDEVTERGMLEVLPLTHLRGRSLHDSWVIVDEAQSLERNVLLTVLSRMGRNSKVVLTHDVAQRDNLRVGRHDGIAAVVETLKGHPLFGHVTLTRSERSPIAELVTSLLQDDG